MEIRSADPADTSRIREVAEDSFRSSYALSPQDMESILSEAFADDALRDRFEDPDVTFLVAEADVDGRDADVQGFIDATSNDKLTIRWLHVDPAARGRGVGSALIERCREEMDDGQPLEARLLADAVEGSEFLTGFGLERGGSDEAEYGDVAFAVDVYTEDSEAERADEPSVTVPDSVEADGQELHLDREDSIPGRDSPFFRLYTDPDEEDEYGYFCSECGSTDVSADGLDRLVCNECDNLHRADEWDGAFL